MPRHSWCFAQPLPRQARRYGSFLAFAVVGRPTDEDKAPVAISAIDIAFFVDLQPYPRMAERRRDIAAAIASYARFTDADCFGLIRHATRLAKRHSSCNALGSVVVEGNRPSSGI